MLKNFSSEASTAATALTTTYVRTLMPNIPDTCSLGLMAVNIVDPAALSATTATWYLSVDAEGDQPITELITSTIRKEGTGAATEGGFARSLENLPWLKGSWNGELANQFYMNLKLNAADSAGGNYKLTGRVEQ